jgi:ABC-type Na+ efflux pump permease subunit
VALIGHNTLREAVRQKLLLFLGMLGLALVVSSQWFREFDFGASELKFLADCGFGAMAFFGSSLVIAATAQLFFSEIENRTALTLLAKPVWRAEFILGKFAGIVALAGIFCALLTTLLAAIIWVRETEIMRLVPEAFPGGRAAHYSNLFFAGALQWLKLSVLGALMTLVASFAQTQLFTVATGFFVVVICHLQHLAQAAYSRGAGTFGSVVAAPLTLIFPDFQVFTIADSLAATDAPAWFDLVRICGYGGGYMVVACALAAWSFRHREI